MLVVTAALGCHVTGTFACTGDEQCHVTNATGRCELTGFCSLPDDRCASGSRYDSSAGGGLGGACVVGVDAGVDTPDAFPPLEVRIDVGGPMVVGVDYPGTWDADPGACANGTTFTSSQGINGTVDNTLFQYEVFSLSQLDCAVPALPVGNYQVTLLFAELYYGCGGPPGPHTFTIALEGSVVGAVDTSADGGGCATQTGHPFAKQYEVAVTDGTLDLVFDSASDGGVVSAIGVVRGRDGARQFSTNALRRLLTATGGAACAAPWPRSGGCARG